MASRTRHARTKFKRPLAQGGIATGLLHALVAMEMPGPGSLFMRQNWSFPRPMYIGDSIRAEATVKSVRERPWCCRARVYRRKPAG